LLRWSMPGWISDRKGEKMKYLGVVGLVCTLLIGILLFASLLETNADLSPNSPLPKPPTETPTPWAIATLVKPTKTYVYLPIVLK
jgi:hypothetical protein